MTSEITLNKIASGEIIPPGSGVDVWYRASPFKKEREHFRSDSALTIAEIVDLARSLHSLQRGSNLHVTLDGHSIPTDKWHRIRVKPGVTVNIVAVPQGNAFKQILGIVAAVAAAFFAPILAGPILSTLGIASGSLAAITLTGAIASGLTISKGLSCTSLFPSKDADNETGQ